MASPELFVALDVVSAALLLLVDAFFFRLWRATREALHLLLVVGFFLVGASYLSVATSELDLASPPLAIDAIQLSGQLAGALVLLMGYLSVRRHGKARFWNALGWTAAAGAALVVAIYLVLPPFVGLPNLGTLLPIAHGLMFLALAGCAVLSLSGYARRPTLDRALVPAAFGCLAATKYTWLLFDVTASSNLVPFVYVWRLVGIALLLFAVGLPPRDRSEEDRA